MTMPVPHDDPSFPEFLREVLQAAFRELAGEVEGHIRRLDAKLDELGRNHITKFNKKWFNTKEAAELLGVSVYTLREHCRLNRVNATKTHGGRGNEAEWRVSLEEIERILNEGLLPLKKESDIRRPSTMQELNNFYSVAQFAALVGETELTIRNKCDAGEIQAEFIRQNGEAVGHYRIPKTELNKYRRRGA